MLTCHVLNVGHGSSVVVQHRRNDNTSVFGVVDSNVGKTHDEPKALTKLKSLGAKELAFVLLTHPHRDHFSGLRQITQHYRGKIASFYSPPLGTLAQNTQRLKKTITTLQARAAESDDEPVRSSFDEFISILQWGYELVKEGGEWIECTGDENRLAPPGFADVAIHTILPQPRVKGEIAQMILAGDSSWLGHQAKGNALSLALQLQYAGHSILLGGDGTAKNWGLRRNFEAKTKSTIASHGVNLPHHGSKYDCTEEVLTQLFGHDDTSSRYAVTSGDGERHPDVEVIEWLEQNRIKPYCTNLIPRCGSNISKLRAVAGVDPVLAKWIREMSESRIHPQVCQGDIKIHIDAGQLSVEPEYHNACGFRGDFGLLLQS
jgi:beta-lactamase superfamily II metal-dependent hydrolase